MFSCILFFFFLRKYLKMYIFLPYEVWLICWLGHDYGFVWLARYHSAKSRTCFSTILCGFDELKDSISYRSLDLAVRIHNAPHTMYFQSKKKKHWTAPSQLTELNELFSMLALLEGSIDMIGFLFPYDFFKQIWIVAKKKFKEYLTKFNNF